VLLGATSSVAMQCSESSFDLVQSSPWHVPSHQIVPTVYYQGMFCSQAQCAKYTGDRGFLSTTGEHVVCANSIDVIHTPYIGVEIDEVQPKIPFAMLWQHRVNPLNLLTALYYYTHYLVSQMQNKRYGITVSSNQYSHQTIAGHSITISQINIGQKGDVYNHQEKYDKLAAEYGECPIILYGVSRGAATSFNALALAQYPNVRVAIFEGCFDSHQHLMQERWPTLSSLGAQNVLITFLEKVSKYKRNGINPIDTVATFPKHVPTLFVTSKNDAEVPASCTRALAWALAHNGHQEVYLLELEHSAHPRYMMDSQHDKELYEHVVHALYQKLQLPHKPDLAEKGKKALELCHVSCE
jgi:hypothetical protein